MTKPTMTTTPNDAAVNAESAAKLVSKRCGRLLVGCGSDFYDPICTLKKGHSGLCASVSATGNYHTDFDADARKEKSNVKRPR